MDRTRDADRDWNPNMDPQSQPQTSSHDETLIEWFLSLTPAQRLAELESRLAFINSARSNVDVKISPSPSIW